MKGTFAGPKAVYCFDVLELAARIRASRSGSPGARGAAGPDFDPSRLAPAVQEYVQNLAGLDPVTLADRVTGIAQFVSLEPGALSSALDYGDGPLRSFAANLPLPPALRATIEDPSQLVDRLNDFRPCELSGLRPNWDPATVVARFGEIGDLIEDVQNVLARNAAIQSVTNAIRTLLGRCAARSTRSRA